MGMLSIMAKKLQHVLHGEFGGSGFPLDGGVRELAFLVLEVEDTFFDGVFDGEFVDDDILGLVESVDAVDGLFFYELGWIGGQ